MIEAYSVDIVHCLKNGLCLKSFVPSFPFLQVGIKKGEKISTQLGLEMDIVPYFCLKTEAASKMQMRTQPQTMDNAQVIFLHCEYIY